MKTTRQIEKEKELRRQIVLFAKNTLQLNIEELRCAMKEKGFGDSLRKLNLSLLIYLKNELSGVEFNPKDILDSQGRYICFLASSIGWQRKKLYLFIAYKFDKSEIRYLSKQEKGAMISILKQIKEKGNSKQ